MSRRRALFRYLAARLALVPVMLWLIASLVFLLLRVAPGDPVDAVLGTRAPEAARAALRSQLGLDRSLLEQYGQFLTNLLRGNLGESLNSQEPVAGIIGRSLPASLELVDGASHFSPVRLSAEGRPLFQLGRELVGEEPERVQALLLQLTLEFLEAGHQPALLSAQQRDHAGVRAYVLDAATVQRLLRSAPVDRGAPPAGPP